MKSSLPFFLTNKKFILSISILFFLLVCGKDNSQKQKEWELKKLNLGINFGFPSFIQIPAPMREFPKIFDIKPSFAIQSCEIKISGGFLADGYNSFCGDYRKENIIPTKLAYVQKAEISPESKIFGELLKVDGCFPDLKDEFLKAKNQNDNVKVGKKLGKDKILRLKDESLKLEGGVYYFKDLILEGNSSLEFEGITLIFVEGVFDLGSKSKLNLKGHPFYLRVASERSKIEGKMKGLLISREVELKGEGEIFGGVIAEKFEAGGGSGV
jgi:cytoskeletal protein CcmA (bactofilin family)